MNRCILRQEQRYDWDCGLACADSVLISLCQPPLSYLTRADIWSVDVAILLSNSTTHSKTTLYSTSVSGINPALADLPFYSQTFSIQTERLPNAFAAASACGVSLVEQRVPIEALDDFLTDGARVILLCDASRLFCIRAGCIRGLKKPRELSYSGHYVVLAVLPPSPSISRGGALATVLDPAPGACASGCSISIAALELARDAVGCDNDVIVVTTTPPALL